MIKRKLFASLAIVFLFLNVAFGYDLTILHSNDTHGRIAPIEYDKSAKPVGGWARRVGLIKQIKKDTKNTLVLDAGDVYQGSIYYQLFNGFPEMEFLDNAGYDAVCVGNHELDNGIEAFENLVKMTKAPFLGANIEFKNNYFLNGKIKSHIIKDYEGFRVAIIGMTTPELKHLSSYSNEIDQPDYYNTLNFLVNYLKKDADLIVLLSHSGAEKDIETAKTIDGIDVIVGGHSHTFMERAYLVNKNGRKTLVVQDGEFGVKLGRLDISFDNNGIENYTYKLLPLDDKTPVDPKTQKKVDELNREVDKVEAEKIGTTKVQLDFKKEDLCKGLTNTGELILEALMESTSKPDIGMINAGTIRGNKTLPKGKISKMDILELLPFPNHPVIAELKGRDIKSILETSVRYYPRAAESFLQTKGLSYTIDTSAKPQVLSEDLEKVTKEGNRIKNVKINGKSLDENATYKVITTDYLFNGGDGYSQFKNAQNFSKLDCFVTGVVTDYIKKQKRVNPKVKDEIIVEE